MGDFDKENICKHQWTVSMVFSYLILCTKKGQKEGEVLQNKKIHF